MMQLLWLVGAITACVLLWGCAVSFGDSPEANFSREYIQEHRGKVVVEIPEIFELANVAIAITEDGLNDPRRVYKKGDYYERVLEHFMPFKDHPLIAQPDVTRNNTYHFRDNSFCYQFDGDKIVHGGVYPRVRTPDLFGKHLALVEDFARKSNFRQFYRENLSFYQEQVRQYRKSVPIRGMWEWLERRFPGRHECYRVVFSPLIGSSHETCRFAKGDFSETVMFISGLRGPQDYAGAAGKALLARVVFTEIDHNYVNAVTRTFLERVQRAFTELDRWNSQKGYRSAELTFNEYMTWAVFILYAHDVYDEAVFETIRQSVVRQMEQSRKFVRFGAFTEELLRLYASHQEGESLVNLYPGILTWVEGVDLAASMENSIDDSATFSNTKSPDVNELESYKLMHKMMQAYRNMNTGVFRSSTYWIYADSGLRTASGGTHIVAFDRSRDAARFESAFIHQAQDGAASTTRNLLLVSDGRKICFCDARRSTTSHVEVPLIKPLTYQQLTLAAPPFESEVSPCFYLLLDEDPMDVLELILFGLGNGQAEMVSPRPGDRPPRPGLRFAAKESRNRLSRWVITFWLDPETHLVTQVTTEGQSHEYIAVEDIELVSRNKSIHPDLFVFDYVNSKPISHYRQLRSDRRTDVVAGESVESTITSQSVARRPAPTIELMSIQNEQADVDLSKQGVVILYFWSVNCDFSIAELPRLQELYEWVRTNEKEVAVYCINHKDSSKDASEIWRDKGFTMPVLMDAQGLVAESYAVNSLPSVFVIHGGVVVDGPDMSYRRLKLLVDFLLDKEGDK